jgi:hypothetical protein
MGELGLDEDRLEARHVGPVALHKDDVDNVVPDVALSLHLVDRWRWRRQ